MVSPEQELAWIMSRIGPVVAIGKPGEHLPPLGAARVYVDDNNWRDTIAQLMDQAAVVVVRAGDTTNLWWEIEEAVARVPPGRVLIVALGPPEQWSQFKRQFIETFGAPTLVDDISLISTPLRWVHRLLLPKPQGAVIYFDPAGLPIERSLRMPDGFSLIDQHRNHYSEYGVALYATLEPILVSAGFSLGRLGRSQTLAVMLALVGGTFGAHHFYLGNRRRGVWCCVFWWTLVPFVLGLVDTIRLALLSDTQFSRCADVRNPSTEVAASPAAPGG